MNDAEAAASKAWSDMGVEFVEGKRTSLPDWRWFAPAFMAGYRRALEDAATLAGTFNEKGLVPHSFDVAHELRARALLADPGDSHTHAHTDNTTDRTYKIPD